MHSKSFIILTTGEFDSVTTSATEERITPGDQSSSPSNLTLPDPELVQLELDKQDPEPDRLPPESDKVFLLVFHLKCCPLSLLSHDLLVSKEL